MIYVCVPAFNEAATVGLVLWKIREVFTEFPREHQILLVNDGSTDETADVVDPYTKVLPLTVVNHEHRLGYARSLESLVGLALKRCERPKRDCAVLLQADFTHDPASLPSLIKGIESGADIVIGEDTGARRGLRIGERVARAAAPRWLRDVVGTVDVHDVTSGFAAFRLITLKRVFNTETFSLTTADPWCVNAELLSLAQPHARRIMSVDAPSRYELRQRTSRHSFLGRLRAVLHARSTVARTAS